ncbi:acyl-CoA dehydrogenase family protein [bacterium]|nr:acyl-CoA dehydrogenase family protein [bacterium]
MDYQLTDTQAKFRELAGEIAEKHIKPLRGEYDHTGAFPREIVKYMADADLFRLIIPREYEGLGGGVMDMVVVAEELSRVCGGISLAYAATMLGTFPILLYASEVQKLKYLPQIASGKKLAAFALTEPNAGSDVSAVRTRAVKKGSHYVLNGTKQWITNGKEADIYSVVTSTDPSRGARGMSAFIVEKGTEGFSFGKKENKLGIRGSTTMELVFDNCYVPPDNLIGREGAGFLVAMRTFDISRPGVAAQALGIAQGVLETLIAFTKEHHLENRPLISSQGVQWQLADIATEVEAARALIYQVARNIDSGEKNVATISSMAKVYASDIAVRAANTATQIMGGYGFLEDFHIEKMLRDAKITQIYEGTNQIQRNIIALGLIKEYGSHKN